MQIQEFGASVLVQRERRNDRPVANLAAEMQVHEEAATSEQEEADARLEAQPDAEQTRAVWLPEAKQTVYRVVHTETGEVIQQIPSEEVMRVARNGEKFLTLDDSESDVQS